jgi:hypothetical protein
MRSVDTTGTTMLFPTTVNISNLLLVRGYDVAKRRVLFSAQIDLVSLFNNACFGAQKASSGAVQSRPYIHTVGSEIPRSLSRYWISK